MKRSHMLVRASMMAFIMVEASTAAGAQTAASDQERTEAVARAQQQRARAALNANAPKIEPSDEDIVVVGVQKSIAAARQEKRNADQIVDVVKAEDIGKLPNNTVADVVSLIPGVQISRDEGGIVAGGIQVRGMSDVQTTLNGVPITNSLDRVGSLNQLPSDLVKSIEVYKNRTADQVEGSGGGTINVELRRPTDFKRGLSGAIIGQGRYVQQAGRVNQNYTGILNYRADTGIGDMGLQLTVTYNANPFLESRTGNDNLTTMNPRQVTGQQMPPVPLVGPSQVYFSYVSGERNTTAYSGSAQWKPQDNVDIVVEGTYTTVDWTRDTHQLFLAVLPGNSNVMPALSNLKLVPGTNRLASVTVSPVTQVGPIAFIYDNPNDSYFGQIKGRWVEEQFELTAAMTYSSSLNTLGDRAIRNRFVNRPEYDVEFASADTRYPMMNATIRGVDMLDPAQYRFAQYDEAVRTNNNRTIAGQTDLLLRTNFEPLDRLKFGMRWEDKRYERRVRSRAYGNVLIPAADMPDGFKTLVPIAEGFKGTGVENNARWLAYDSKDVRAHFDDLRQYISQFSPAFVDKLPALSTGDFFNGREYSFAAYGQFHYDINLLFPIDGWMGVRAAMTDVKFNSFERRTRTAIVNGTNQTVIDLTPTTGNGNYLAILPSLNAIIHFTPKLQLRLGYTKDFRRPRVFDLSPSLTISEIARTGSVGNPGLQPERSTKYDASAEYYFGKTGLVSVAPFYWQLDGAFTNFQALEFYDEDPIPFVITRPYNAGKGYRRGVELQAQTFFTFLPGPLSGFGAQANYTYTESSLKFSALPGARTNSPASAPIVGTAKNVFNVAGLFERGGLNARVSYNWRGKILTEIRNPLVNSRYMLPVDWMDAAINYTVRSGLFKGLTLSAQASNILASTRREFYGFPDQPREVIYMSRTYGGGIRYNF